jgi:porin
MSGSAMCSGSEMPARRSALARRMRQGLLGLLALLAAGTARAEDAPGTARAGDAPGPSPATTPPPAATTSATTIRLQYTGEAAANLTGGLRDGGSYTNSIDADLRVDTGRAFGWTGGQFRLEGFYTNATSLNDTYVGALQDPSPIDTGQGALFRLYQAYYEQRFGATNVLVGLYDLQNEFGATRPMDIFMNGASAWNSVLDVSGRNGPSTYPNTAPAIRLRQRIDKEWTVKFAVTNGVPDSAKNPGSNAINFNRVNGAFMIGEVDYQPARNTKLIAGVWDYTSKFDALNGRPLDTPGGGHYGGQGGYVGGATRLWSQGGSRGIDGFATVGMGYSLVDTSLDIGATWTGPFAARPHDKLGLAFGLAHASDELRGFEAAGGVTPTHLERTVELTYRAPVNDWLVLQPDVQYFRHPGFDASRKDDWLLMLHFELGHVFGL